MCITGAADARELLGVTEALLEPVAGERTDDRTRLMDALSIRSFREVDDIARRSGLAPEDVTALIGLAALAGEVERSSNGWRRIPRP